jgi:hypothetical protein
LRSDRNLLRSWELSRIGAVGARMNIYAILGQMSVYAIMIAAALIMLLVLPVVSDAAIKRKIKNDHLRR